MRRFDQDVNVPGVQFKEATRKTPDKMGNILIMLVFAFGVIALTLLCFLMLFSETVALQATGALGLILIVAVVISALTNGSVFQTLETITGHDLDRDGYVGQVPMTAINFQASERTSWMAELPAPEALCLEWGRAALGGHSLAYKSWSGQFALMADGSDGADRYREFRIALCGSMLAREKGQHGITLTDRGIQLFTEYAAQQPPGTPLLEG